MERAKTLPEDRRWVRAVKPFVHHIIGMLRVIESCGAIKVDVENVALRPDDMGEPSGSGVIPWS